MASPGRNRSPVFLLLQQGEFRSLWIVSILGELSRRLEVLVLSWLILQETESPLRLALVLVFTYLSRPLVSPFAGVLADRLGRKRILLGGHVVNALTAMAILLLLATDRIDTWHVYLSTFVRGATWALDEPSRRTGVFDIVGPKLVVSAMSLDITSTTAGRLAGPIIGGVLLGLVGFEGAYVFAVAVYIIAVVLMAGVTIPETREPGPAAAVWKSLAEATAYAVRSPMLAGMLCVTFLMNGLANPVQHFVPAIGRDVLGVGPVLVGLLASAEGFGQVTSSVVMATRDINRTHGLMLVGGSLGVLVMALLFLWSPWYAASFAALTLGGVGMAAYGTMQSSIAMLWAPRDMRVTMMGLRGICIGVGTPVGSLSMGLVAGALGIQLAISSVVLAGLALLLLVIFLTPALRTLAPTPAATGAQPSPLTQPGGTEA